MIVQTTSGLFPVKKIIVLDDTDQAATKSNPFGGTSAYNESKPEDNSN